MALEKRYFKELSHYSSGYVLFSVVSFISFPLLTRILPVNEYGILGLVTSTISIGLVISGLGLQQSLIRYYADFRAEKKQDSLSVYYSTFFLSTLFLGLAGSLIFLFVAQTALKKILEPETVRLFSFVSILVLLGCLSASLRNFLRAEQETKLFNFVLVITRIGGLIFGFFFIFFMIKGVFGFFFGSALVSCIVVILLIKRLYRHQTISWKYFSLSLIKKALAYGLPLSILEISHSLLNVADRYIIQYYLDSVALGLYSAAYTLSMHVVQFIDYPILLAVPVLYFELWSNRGAEAVQTFLKDGLYYFGLIAFPAMFGTVAVSKELLVFLASDKFATSSQVIPFVTVGGLIFASSTFFSAGLYIYEKTVIPGLLMLISASINLFLNFLLVPKYGIMGAAFATLIGYTSYVVMVIPVSFKYLSYRPDFKALGRSLLYSSAMFIVIMQINLHHGVANLFARVLTGSLIYLAFVFSFEVRVRKLFVGLISRKPQYISNIRG